MSYHSKDSILTGVFVFLFVLVFGLLFSYAFTVDAERSDCTAAHGVCVDTSNGWKPYYGGEQ